MHPQLSPFTRIITVFGENVAFTRHFGLSHENSPTPVTLACVWRKMAFLSNFCDWVFSRTKWITNFIRGITHYFWTFFPFPPTLDIPMRDNNKEFQTPLHRDFFSTLLSLLFSCLVIHVSWASGSKGFAWGLRIALESRRSLRPQNCAF